MPQISSMDANYHAAQELIYALHNPAPTSPLLKLGKLHQESLKNLADIFRKANHQAVPQRVPVREVGQRRLQKVNHGGTQMKGHRNQTQS